MMQRFTTNKFPKTVRAAVSNLRFRVSGVCLKFQGAFLPELYLLECSLKSLTKSLTFRSPTM